MSSRPDVPVFHSDTEAFKYLNRVRWDDGLTKEIRDKIKTMKEDAGVYQSNHNIDWNNHRSAFLQEQIVRLQLCLNIIGNFKPKDAAMSNVGATMYAGSIPVQRGKL